MKNVMEFLSAALPWICMGLLLAIFLAQSARKKKDNKKNENNGMIPQKYTGFGDDLSPELIITDVPKERYFLQLFLMIWMYRLEKLSHTGPYGTYP